jgi:hypothetical protein
MRTTSAQTSTSTWNPVARCCLGTAPSPRHVLARPAQASLRVATELDIRLFALASSRRLRNAASFCSKREEIERFNVSRAKTSAIEGAVRVQQSHQSRLFYGSLRNILGISGLGEF